jgi:glutamine---fructose-6-phosphate transaminase (isomerizing)
MTLMAAEMADQPEVLARLAARAPADAAAVRAVVPRPLAGIVFLARGSSDNAAVFGRYLAELSAGRPAGLAAPSIYTRYHARVDWHGYLMVALSQSGATPEIISTCQAVREAGATVIGITNEPGSPLAGAVDLLLATDAGPERAVPATKTVTAQFAVLMTVAAALGSGPAAGDALAALPGMVAATLADPGPASELAGRWSAIDRLVVAGRGLGYAAALETALKVAETTGILADGISAADLYHGPIAAVYAGAPVLMLPAGGPGDADLAALRGLLDSRRAETAVLPVPAMAAGTAGQPATAAETVAEPATAAETVAEPAEPAAAVTVAAAEPAQVITAVVRGQQLAYALALARGADPDAPAHLTKVTETT